MRDQQWFSLTSACHVSIGVWNHSTLVQNLLPFKGTSINNTGFPERESHLVLSALFPFPFLPTVFRFPHATKYSGFSFTALFARDVRLALIAHQKPPLFLDPGIPGATLTSCTVSMGLGQCALTEVLVIPRWLPLPLVQGVFDGCFGFFRDLFPPNIVMVP